MEFRGIRSAAQSIQFIANHLGFFLKLTGVWAAIEIAFIIAVCLLFLPAGPGTSLGDNLVALSGARWRLARSLPQILLNIAISVSWIRFILLGEKPRNPVRLTNEMAGFFGQSIAVGFLALASAIPGGILFFALPEMFPTASAKAAAAFVSLVLAIGPFIVVYARLLLALGAKAAGDESIDIAGSFELTKGRSPSLAAGFALTYFLPFLALFIAKLLAAMFSTLLPTLFGGLLLECIDDFGTCVIVGVLAGFIANVYAALAPGDLDDKVARQFE